MRSPLFLPPCFVASLFSGSKVRTEPENNEATRRRSKEEESETSDIYILLAPALIWVMARSPIRVLFVCTGNICRSPTAEGVFFHQVEEAGLSDRIEADSAGTIDYHAGDPPDPRAVQAAARRGVDISSLRARKVSKRDFSQFHYLLAMDHDNRNYLRRACPTGFEDRLHLLLDFASVDDAEVPDPYYGGVRGFAHVLDLCEDGARGLLEDIRTRQGFPSGHSRSQGSDQGA